MARKEAIPLLQYQSGLNYSIGLSEGLIVPLAVMGAVIPFAEGAATVINTGLLITLAGAVVMAVGGYITNRSAVDGLKKEAAYRKQSEAILHHIDMQEFIGSEIPDPHEAEAEARLVQMQEDFASDPDSGKLPVFTAVQIGLSYLIAGMLTLLPFYFIENTLQAFMVAAAICFTGLVIAAAIKSRYNGISFWGNAFRLLLIAAFAVPGPLLVSRYFIN